MPPEESTYPKEWLSIARKDWGRVDVLLRLDDVDGAAFFLQQAVEKYLKALLQNVKKAYLHFLDVGHQSRMKILITPIFIKNSCI